MLPLNNLACKGLNFLVKEATDLSYIVEWLWSGICVMQYDTGTVLALSSQHGNCCSPDTYLVSGLLQQLKQLERLRSEIPSATPRLPILVIYIRSQVKKKQSESCKF